MNTSELLKALSALRQTPDSHTNEEGWFTAQELCNAWGFTLNKVNELLNDGIEHGIVEKSTGVRHRTDGRAYSVNVYRQLPSGGTTTAGSS